MATQKSTHSCPQNGIPFSTETATLAFAAGRDELHGYRPNQIEEVFEDIAEKAAVLRDFLQAAGLRSDVKTSCDFSMARSMAALIGAVADQMSGFEYIGTVASWATCDGIDPEPIVGAP